MWFLPIALIVFTLIIAIPLSKYIAWIMEGKYRPWAGFRWVEKRLETGPMNWKQYTAAVAYIQYSAVSLGVHRPFATAGDAAK
jgi:K+-transporting ATPase ATPase A chain